MNPRIITRLLGALCACLAVAMQAPEVAGQTFRYEPKAKVDLSRPSYASPDPAPRMMLPSERLAERPVRREYGHSSSPRLMRQSIAERARYDLPSSRQRSRLAQNGPHLAGESIPPGRSNGPFAEELPFGGPTGEVIEGPPPVSQPYDAGRYGGQYSEQPYQGETFDGGYHGDEFHSGEGFEGDGYGEARCNSCGECGGCDDCDVCGPCYVDMLHAMCACMRQTYLCSSGMWKNLSLYTGKQGFKGPVDQGMNGNFGYNAGLNWGSPLWHKYGIGYQLGGSIVASDFEGSSGPLEHSRTQSFVTTGFYRRARCDRGFQGGVVFDYLHDNFYVQMDLMQLRGELSYVYNAHELGFWFATHLNTDTQTAPSFMEDSSVTWSANDQYNIFYRYQFCNGATARSWAGLTSHGDGIFGGDATVGFTPKWAVQTSYNYLLPCGDSSTSGNVRESWNLSINLVWNPGYKKGECDWFNPYRPLFNVADNGWFLERVR